jgi:hypothetical protein
VGLHFIAHPFLFEEDEVLRVILASFRAALTDEE